MTATDDLTPLLVPQAAGSLRLGQARVLEFDPDTFEGAVDWQGSVIRNLPVGAGLAGLTLRPGDTVILHGWKPGDGAESWYIAHKLVVPGTDAAEQAIAALRTDAGRAVALAVFGEAIRADSVDDSVSIGDQNGASTWIDLPGSIGPTVSDVEISESGRAWVFMTARMSVETHTTDAQIVQAGMSYEISGATSRAPDLARALELEHIGQTVGDNDTNVVFVTMTRAHVATALNPGVHTFQAKYTALVSGSERATFSRRELQVIPF